MQWVMKNNSAIQRIAQPQKFICVTGVWEPPNKHETTHSRRDGNEWFLPFVPTKALLASYLLLICRECKLFHFCSSTLPCYPEWADWTYIAAYPHTNHYLRYAYREISRSAPLLCRCFPQIRWRCKDGTGKFRTCNRFFHPGYLRPCDRKDEERQCRPDAGLYQVRKLIRENVRETKNPPLKSRTIWTSKAEITKRNPWIRKNPGWI